jgi:CBS-domain-containing membrane protein
VLREDVVTAPLDDSIGQVREQVTASPYGFALVIAADRTVLGRLRQAVLQGDGSLRAEDVMEPGPSTVRADSPLEKLTERLRARDLHTAIVTTPEGRLLGVVRRADAERALTARPRASADRP